MLNPLHRIIPIILLIRFWPTLAIPYNCNAKRQKGRRTCDYLIKVAKRSFSLSSSKGPASRNWSAGWAILVAHNAGSGLILWWVQPEKTII